MLHLLFTRLFLALKGRHESRKAIGALSQLDDRLLRDIGIHRFEIDAVVHRSVAAGRACRARPGRAVVLPNGTLMGTSCCPPRAAHPLAAHMAGRG